jgi:hypothetical protein
MHNELHACITWHFDCICALSDGLFVNLSAACSVTAAQQHLADSSSNSKGMRKLLNQPTQLKAQNQPPLQQQPVGTPVQSSAANTSCCSCKCVNPAKDMRSDACKALPGCVGMAAPTYSLKNVCVAGANRKCEDVCVRDMGGWTALYEC